ncbi:aminoimidazole riboside kinase [Kluyvera ascorbata]|uniref:aminoimidazole riboside kinase n=1 Tax=Kluyvera ascorbata TaxID=51288 RepID=UPI00289EF282|nr:aminoimidazole riboside kinase [Kluyvera ascorbata]MEB6389960.1 aminoimidazole riboside kinase [Kluyvera ascorbata]HDG1710751.1 aminoimidazole riboside kinase [Kluyvera ascorbata]HED3065363.1 aminoimidazole riboside kinase [Kluyvera ascorbata]
MTIWTLGDAVVDLLPRDNMQFEACAGGAPFNVAIGVARLGHDSGFIGRVGNDAFGRFLHQTLVTAQVDTKSLEFDPKRHTSTVLVSLDSDGERQFDFLVNPSADQFLSPASLPDFGHDILHFCSLALVAPDCRATLTQAMAAMRQAGGTLSFDINLRPQMWSNETQMFDQVSDFARQSDILKMSEEELLWLTQTDDLNSACERLTGFPARLKIITRGADGAIAFWQNHRLTLSGYHVDSIDTTGAGDAFMAGLLAALAGAGWPASTAALSSLLEQASACGALATTQRGALSAFPNNQQLSRFIQSQPSLRRTINP